MNKILIVVDMQNDFVYGPLGTPEARAIVPNVEKKVDEYHKNGYDVIFTKDIHFEDYLDTHEGKRLPVPHCVNETNGDDIIILGEWGDTVALKSEFGITDWPFFFKEADPELIELVGVCTDICVVSNALILRSTFPEIDITVDASCCAGTTPEKHKAALEVMKSCHIDVINE